MSKPSTDYTTYKDIIDDLLKPIAAEGLDHETLHRLYESKLVYLENLRVKCFREINFPKAHGQVAVIPAQNFSTNDYQLILHAITETKLHLRSQVLQVIKRNLSKVKVSA